MLQKKVRFIKLFFPVDFHFRQIFFLAKSGLYIRWMYLTKNKTSPSKSKGEAKCCGGLGKEETQHRQKGRL